MANKHYDLDKSFIINLKVKVDVKTIYNYHPLKQWQLKVAFESIKEDIVYALDTGIMNVDYLSNSEAYDGATVQCELIDHKTG